MACMNVLLSLTHCVLLVKYVHGTHKVSWGMGEGLILLLEALHEPNVPKLRVCGGGQLVVEAAGGSLCNDILS